MSNKIMLRALYDCPYCGNDCSDDVKASERLYNEVVQCKTEIGGCGRRFVLDILTTVSATVRKIEGEQ